MKVRARAYPLTPDQKKQVISGMSDPRGHRKGTDKGSHIPRMRTSPPRPIEGVPQNHTPPLLYASNGLPAYERDSTEPRADVVKVGDKVVMQARRPKKPRRVARGWDEKAGAWAMKK